MEELDILGLKVNKVTFNEAVETIKGFVSDGGKHLVVTPYAESVVDGQKDEEFRKIINSASLSVPDGGSLLAAAQYLCYQLPENKWLRLPIALLYGLVVGFRLAFNKNSFSALKERVSGTDLVVSLCEMSSQTGKKIYFLGGGGNEAREAAQVLKSKYSSLQIMTDAGPAHLKKAPAEEISLTIKKVNDYSPDFLFVAFAPGEQEKWLFYHMEEINAKVFMAVGGAFNMISGRKKRAPKIFQRFNLEWLWRLMIEPSRIRRIYKAVIVFPWLVFCQKLKGSVEFTDGSPAKLS